MMQAAEEPREPSPTSVMESGEVKIGSNGNRKQRRRKKVGATAPVMADLNDVNGKGVRRRRKSKQESKTLHYVVGLVCVVLLLGLLFSSATHRDNLRMREIERLRKTVEYVKKQNGVGKHRAESKYSPEEHENFLKESGKVAENHVAEEESSQGGFLSLFGSRKKNRTPPRYTMDQLDDMLEELDEEIMSNHLGLTRWTAPHLMLPLEGDGDVAMAHEKNVGDRDRKEQQRFFKARRKNLDEMAWYQEFENLESEGKLGEVALDYAHYEYDYPEIQMELPQPGAYPPMETLGDVMRKWPQDQDFDGPIIKENLFHFNFSDPNELEAARLFRDAELPFKLYDIPELTTATDLWTDDYVSHQFDSTYQSIVEGAFRGGDAPKADGLCQESQSNFFAFFTKQNWDIQKLGLPPTRDNNWSFKTWSNHARYADATVLDANRPHFYWQSGVPKEERHKPPSEWTFISRDLPFLSSPTENFFVFHPSDQKGIQCRFGERGVVAATHYDSGRNMVAMITGAKRYILSPPRECYKLEISTNRKNPIYRHSLLNFGHINNLDSDEGMTEDNYMSDEERAWLKIAATADAIDTVLKAGEVLYIPSHWFHYIASLQKSAQCNVRSGVNEQGSAEFGGRDDVRKCKAPRQAQKL